MMSALSTIENPKVPTEKTVSTLGFSIVLSVFPLPRAWYSVHIFRSFSRPVPSSVSPSAPHADPLFPPFPPHFPPITPHLYVLRHIPHKNPVSGLARPRVFSIFASAALSSGVKFFYAVQLPERKGLPAFSEGQSANFFQKKLP